MIIIHSINHIHHQWNANALNDDKGVPGVACPYRDDRDKTDGRPDVRVNFFTIGTVYVCKGSIKQSISPHITTHIHTVLSCTLAEVHKDVVIHMYIHTCQNSVTLEVVDIDTITVLLMKARLVSTIKIKSVYPL